MLLLAVFLAAGCQSSDQKASDQNKDKNAATKENDKTKDKKAADSDQSAPSSDTNSDKDSDQKAAIAKTSETVQKAMDSFKTTLVKRSPVYFPVDPSQSLTAATSSKDNQYKVLFYAADQPQPVNSEEVKAMGEDEALASFSAQSYPTADKAKAAVNPQPKVTDGNVDLGHNITAKASSGTGQTSFTWDEGDWSFQLMVPVALTNFGEEIGKQMVTYLDSHSLPAPQSNGRISVTYGKNKPETQILLQEDKTVYTLKTSEDPVEALKMEVSLKTFK